MFKLLKRRKNNKYAWDDDASKEVAAWIATYILHADNAYQRALRAEMVGGDEANKGQSAYWKNVASGYRWLLSMIRCPVHANDLYLSYMRVLPAINRAEVEGHNRQLTIRFENVPNDRQAIEGGNRENSAGNDSPST